MHLDLRITDTGQLRRSIDKHSLEMRQRLGLAVALLNYPQLLVVDGPTNRLDSAGAVKIRTPLKQLAEQGITIMLSSHQLYEIQQVCQPGMLAYRTRGTPCALYALEERSRKVVTRYR